MGLTEGIRDSVADVYVQTADIRTGVITTDLLGGSAITTAKIQNCAITTDQLAMSVGRWYGGLLSTAGLTVSFTWTATNACTVLKCIVQITAAASAGLIGVANTAPVSFFTASITLATTYDNSVLTCAAGTVTSGTTIVVELTAGGSLIGAVSGAATANTLRGKYFLFYMTTPS